MRASARSWLNLTTVSLLGCSDAVLGTNPPDAELPRTAEAPILDGQMDALYESSRQYSLTQVIRGFPPDTADFAVTWRGLYDTIALYLFVEVTDDAILPSTHPDAGWEDDSVEVFIDGDGSAGEVYDNRNDTQLVFRRDLRIQVGFETPDVPHPAEILSASMLTGNGYTMEVALPWSSINVSMEMSRIRLFGLDIQANDIDEAMDTRGNKLTWMAPNDQAWQRPELFGLVRLAR